jgi:hypothetical protein
MDVAALNFQVHLVDGHKALELLGQPPRFKNELR